MAIENFEPAKQSNISSAESFATRAASALTDRSSNEILKDCASRRSTAEIPVLNFTDEKDDKAKARQRVVDRTADEIKDAIKTDGTLKATSDAADTLKAALQHQFNHNGGAKGADSMADDLTKALKPMSVKITEDAAFKKQIEDAYKAAGEKVPGYIRIVEIFDKDNKSLGKIGVTIESKKD